MCSSKCVYSDLTEAAVNALGVKKPQYCRYKNIPEDREVCDRCSTRLCSQAALMGEGIKKCKHFVDKSRTVFRDLSNLKYDRNLWKWTIKLSLFALISSNFCGGCASFKSSLERWFIYFFWRGGISHFYSRKKMQNQWVLFLIWYIHFRRHEDWIETVTHLINTSHLYFI